LKRKFHGLSANSIVETRRPICTRDSSKFSVFHPLLDFDILTLKIYDLDSNFQGQRSKKVHFGPKRPQKSKYLNYFEFPHKEEHQAAKSHQTKFPFSRSNFQNFNFVV
jgi:hypothetical protein